MAAAIRGTSVISERDFQDNVIELAQTLGWVVHHDRPARQGEGWVTPIQGNPGFPDLVLAKGGRVIFAELKSEKGKVTDNQEAWLTAIQPDPLVEPTAFVWRPSDLEQIQKVLGGTPEDDDVS